MVKPDCSGKVLEDDGRAEFVVRKLDGPQDATMFEDLQEVEFTLGSALNRSAVLGALSRSGEVNPDACAAVGNGDMPAKEILVTGPFIQKVFKLVIADSAALLRRLNADLV
jgi:hypothetical protein